MDKRRRCRCGHSAEAHLSGPNNTFCKVCKCGGYDEIQNPVSVGVACLLIGIAAGALITLIVGWPLGIFVGVPAALVLGRVIFEGIIPDAKPDTCRGCGRRINTAHELGCPVGKTQNVVRDDIDGE